MGSHHWVTGDSSEPKRKPCFAARLRSDPPPPSPNEPCSANKTLSPQRKYEAVTRAYLPDQGLKLGLAAPPALAPFFYPETLPLSVHRIQLSYECSLKSHP